MRVTAMVCALVVCVHGGAWFAAEPVVEAPAFRGTLQSVSYTPFDGSAGPGADAPTAAAQIRADLTALRGTTHAVRTYASTGGAEQIPGIAAEFGLETSIGAWIGRDEDRNAQELAAVVKLAKTATNVASIVVGNETLYRSEQTVAQLIRKIRQVRRATRQPVTTGEVWGVWLEHPELVEEVDFIAAHILPYWEGVPAEQAVKQALRNYEVLHRAYPEKRIVIAEFGWPSAGHNRRGAVPGPLAQAQVLREFVATAERRGLEYNLIEAYDQPWKTAEGSVGAYWGAWNTDRVAKFDWSGTLHYPGYRTLATAALSLGVFLTLPLLRNRRATLPQTLLLAVAAQGVGVWGACLLAFWREHYFEAGTGLAFALGVVFLVPLVVISLYRVEEIAALVLGRRPPRLIDAPLRAAGPLPRVSIHIPACREQPAMVIQTLDAVARLDYPDFECVIVVNNTPDPAMWQPIEAHCQTLGPRFRFVREDALTGYKAGALRLALAHTSPEAGIIAVLDADYAVHPDWLRDLVPAFDDPLVAIVQAPQDHRDSSRSLLHHAMNREYAGFFDIGMVHRNEANGVVVHGTLCLIRRAALEDAGGWASDTICEDTDLGLSVLERGWAAHYTTRRYGHGLLPDTFLAFKRQRHRWAYGGLQIARKHWRKFLPGRSTLTLEQKRVFLAGWLAWLGAESLGVLVALGNLLLVPFVALVGILVPEKVMTVPIVASFAVTMAHFLILYRRKITVSGLELLSALTAAMSLQWTIARAVGASLVGDSLPFVVTAKGGNSRRTLSFPAFWESIIGVALLAGALLVALRNHEAVVELWLFALVLALQSLPFLAAALIATVERSRLNDFAFWTAASGLRPHAGRLHMGSTPLESGAKDSFDPVFVEKGSAAEGPLP
jgi:exo-beta-1,3-glucanase (GH17 family)/cellulose synthase/poly-beta-1,6-N-acetylglucosamine synthase-like glycosyltransferase